MNALPRLTLHLLPDVFAICRLAAEAARPEWATGSFVSLTWTPDELSVVCPAAYVPAGVSHQGGYRCLAVAGPLDLGMTGAMAALAGPLADAGISLFPLATFDTDYLFVSQEDVRRAAAVLRKAGHNVVD